MVDNQPVIPDSIKEALIEATRAVNAKMEGGGSTLSRKAFEIDRTPTWYDQTITYLESDEGQRFMRARFQEQSAKPVTDEEFKKLLSKLVGEYRLRRMELIQQKTKTGEYSAQVKPVTQKDEEDPNLPDWLKTKQ